MNNKYYILKIWISTIVIAPIIIALFLKFSDSYAFTSSSAIEIFIMMTFLGFFFSIPVMLLFSLVHGFLRKRQLPEILKICILCLIAVFGVYTAFYISGIAPFDKKAFIYPAIYAIVISLSTIVYSKWTSFRTKSESSCSPIKNSSTP